MQSCSFFAFHVVLSDSMVCIEYLPASQSVHASALVAAILLPYLSLQSAQLEAPAVAEYLPASHGVHVAVSLEAEPSGPYSPALHANPEHSEELAAEYLPAAQARQVSDVCARTVSEYVPAGQSVQRLLPSDAEYLPAPQRVHELTCG